jgi:hypothetical protein
VLDRSTDGVQPRGAWLFDPTNDRSPQPDMRTFVLVGES